MPASPPTFKTNPNYGLLIETQDFEKRIIANSGTITKADLKVIDDGIRAGKTSGIYNKLAFAGTRLNLMVGDNLASMGVPLIYNFGYAIDVNSGFSAGSYSRTAGLTGDGAHYLDSGYNCTSLNTVTNTLAVFKNDASAHTGVFQYYMGAYSDSPTNYVLINHHSTQGFRSRLLATTSSGAQITTDEIAALYTATRTASNRTDLYQNTSSVANDTTATSVPYAFKSLKIYIGARNNDGTADSFMTTSNKLGGYMITNKSFSSDDVSNFHAMMKIIYDGIGRVGL